MLYLSCPTCGYFLGLKTMEYEDKKAAICSNLSLSTEDKENELSKLLLSLNIKRYCCKMRIMSFKNIVEDLFIPPPTNSE